MRKQGFQIGLLGALALLGFGCAQIINADFDKPFQSGGAGGGSTSMLATVGGTSSGGAGSMGSGGLGSGGLASETSASTGTGEDTVAKCPLDSTDRCDIHVYIKLLDNTTPLHTTIDAILTFDTVAPNGFESSPATMSAFKLYRSPPVSDGVALYSCVYDEEDFTHFVSTVPCPNGILLGYAAKNMPGNPAKYESLSSFSTNINGDNKNNRALIATKHVDALCGSAMPYGICNASNLYAPL